MPMRGLIERPSGLSYREDLITAADETARNRFCAVKPLIPSGAAYAP